MLSFELADATGAWLTATGGGAVGAVDDVPPPPQAVHKSNANEDMVSFARWLHVSVHAVGFDGVVFIM